MSPWGRGDQAPAWVDPPPVGRRTMLVVLLVLVLVVAAGWWAFAVDPEPPRTEFRSCAEAREAGQYTPGCCPTETQARLRHRGLTPAALGVGAEARGLALLCSINEA